MRARAESGGSLAEALVALLLILVVLGAALPVLGQARALAASCLVAAGEGAALRAALWRLERDLERAGFGLPGSVPPLSLGGAPGGLSVAFLEGGFEGGTALRDRVAAGSRTLALVALRGLETGDEVVLRDRGGQVFQSRVVAIDRARDEVEIAHPLPFEARALEGARLWRLERHDWTWGPDGARRDGQSFVERPLAAIVHAARTDGMAGDAHGHAPVADEPGPLIMLHLGAGGGEADSRTPGLPVSVAWRAPRTPAGAALPLP